MIYLFDTLPRFAVPCFVMLSGAFLLGSPRNGDRKYFYCKVVNNTLITTAIFSVLYTLYSTLKVLLKNKYVHNGGVFAIIKPLCNMLIGKPFYHMWYLYMLLGLYFVTPYVIKGQEILDSAGIDLYRKAVWVFLFLASISYWTSSYKLEWDIGTQFKYLSYYLVGYAIYRYSRNHKSNRFGGILIAIGIAIETVLAMSRYLVYAEKLDVSWASVEIFAYEGLDPLVVLSSIPLFTGFAVLDIKIDFSKLSSYTFLIYLFHAGIWDMMIHTVVSRIPFFQHSNFAIPVCVVTVFFLSLISAYFYKLLWNKFDTRFAIVRRILKGLKLAD